MSKPPKRLTERQRFERWYRRDRGREVPTNEDFYNLYYEAIALWEGWQASARAKR